MLNLVLAFFLVTVSSCAFTSTQQPPPPAVETVAEVPAPPTPPADPNAAIKKKVLILPFIDHTGRAEEKLTKSALNEISLFLAGAPEVIPVSLEELPEQGLTPDLGTYSMKKVFRVARTEGILGVLGGTIDDIDHRRAEVEGEIGFFRAQKYTTDVKVTLELYDTTSEKRILTRTETGEVNEERTDILESVAEETMEKERAQQAAVKAVKKIMAFVPPQIQKIAWFGRIARIDWHRYYITGGRATGLFPGQLLRVFVEGDPVYDSQTGKLLGAAPGRLKGLLKIVENFGPDASVAVLHSGAGFREQDRVEPFILPPQN